MERQITQCHNEYINVLQQNEVFLLCELEHVDIIKYYDFYIENNRICVVLEYCEGNLIYR